MIKLKFELCRLNAKMPTKATPGSACFDICAATDYDDILLPGQPLIIPTGLKVEIPEGYALMIYSRSGHGFKNGVRLANCVGVIDSDYRQEILVRLTLDDRCHYQVKAGERIAQAMLINVPAVELVEGEVSQTDRGGFGSTGK